MIDKELFNDIYNNILRRPIEETFRLMDKLLNNDPEELRSERKE